MSEAKSKPLPPHLQRQAAAQAQQQQTPSGLAIRQSDLFLQSLVKMRLTFGDLNRKLIEFIKVKMQDPLNGRYGKHDGGYKSGTPLVGFNHCHLRDDAILTYTMKDNALNLFYICPHSEIEGKAAHKTKALLDKAVLKNVDPQEFIKALLTM